MGELAKIDSFRKDLAIAETIEQIKLIGDAAQAYQYIVKRQGANKQKVDEIGEFDIEVECKKAEWLDTYYPPSKGNNQYTEVGNKTEPTKMPVPKKESAKAKKIKKLKEEKPEVFEKLKNEIKNDKDLNLNAKTLSKEIDKLEKKEKLEQAIKEREQQTDVVDSPTVYLMDAIEFLKTIEDDEIDLLFTDPPYSTDVDDIEEFANSWVHLALKKLKPTGRAYICIGAYPEELKVYLDILLRQDKFIVDNPLIWTYRNTLGVTPKMKYNLNYQVILHLYSANSRPLDTSITNEMFSVQDINAPDGRIGDRFHTWQKPDELARRFIFHSTQIGDLVIDPFACTGTFLLQANKLHRRSFGCDNSRDNLLIAKQRGCTTIGI